MALTETGRKAKQAALDAATRHERKTAAPPPGGNDISEEAPGAQVEPEEQEVERTEPATAPEPPAPELDNELPPPVEPPESFEAPETPGGQPNTDEHSEVEEAISPEAALREHFDSMLSDEETLTAVIEFCKDQKLDVSDLKEAEEGYHGWHSGSTFATITVGRDEYVVAPTEEAADSLAVEIVKSMLDDEPELFNQDWLEGHINTERLRSDLTSDVEEQVRESPDSYGWTPGQDDDDSELVRFNEKGEEDEDGEFDSGGHRIDETDEEDSEDGDTPSDEWVERKAAEILHDPIEYLRDIYGDETMKHAIRIAGIDIDEAADEAVAADGAGHFLSSYDGETHDLPSGGVWWRA
jgi:hypothetical protein